VPVDVRSRSSAEEEPGVRIGVIGGTGREGHGLSLRWRKAGHEVLIGSRDAAKAQAKAAELSTATGLAFEGGSNEWAAREAEVAILCVPYAAHADTLRALAPALQGKALIDITVPLQPPKVRVVHLPPGGSAAREAQTLLGEGVKVVAALHHVSSSHLGEPDHVIDCDVLVCSDDQPALDTTLGLLRDLGLDAWDAGALDNAIALEALTPVLLHLNKKYKSPGAGLRITGVNRG
jgi:8-hydroxy-5-deazaflavin:NADPH oxidoreductase